MTLIAYWPWLIAQLDCEIAALRGPRPGSRRSGGEATISGATSTVAARRTDSAVRR